MLQAIIFYISLPFYYLLSILPFPVLYGLSDLLYIILYRIMGYRTKVVMDNLRRSFPDKKPDEIKQIANRFYRHLCDLLLESFKTLTISKEEMLQRCYFQPEALPLLQQLYDEGNNIIVMSGHLGNWEWGANTFGALSPFQLCVIYHPLSNPYFDRLMYRMRSRFQVKLIAMKQTLKVMLQPSDGLPTATAFLSDQSPPPSGAYWTIFLHQDTPVFMGAEKIARKLSNPVIYLHITKVKRGYYEIGVELLIADASATEAGEITERYTRRLEQDIIHQPEDWLWSHRRWKHQRPGF